ncbi:MAG: metallophosphoesterase [Lachnospiraceae bacterium]|nr:metallophosphoesterase [Lachnospiraceae bacterium]
MKVVIVSDTHGSHRNLEKVLEEEKPMDMLIHLGDVEGGEDYITALADCPTHIVRGNNDFFSNLPGEEEFMMGGYHMFISHGHYYYVSMGEERLKEEARARGADIVMYGHTHKPTLTREEDLITLNPGSIAYPRQEGRRPSYMVMEIGGGDRIEFSLRYL